VENNGFRDLRLFYTKTGSAKYISHLDVMRAFQRAFRRSKIPVWYTEGFHPHLYLTFALPLSLGYESLSESVDFRVTGEISDDDLSSRLAEALPPGFRVMSVAPPEMEPSAIKYAVYDVSFKVPQAGRDAVAAAWRECFGAQQVNVHKRTKHGEKTVDIKPSIVLTDIKEDGGLYSVEMKLAAGTEFNVNPSLVFEAFEKSSGLTTAEHTVIRKAVLIENGENFR